PPIEHPRSSPQRYYSTTVGRGEQMVSPGLALSRDASGLPRASPRPFIVRQTSQHRYCGFARAAFRAAVEQYPKVRIRLRNRALVMEKRAAAVSAAAPGLLIGYAARRKREKRQPFRSPRLICLRARRQARRIPAAILLR